MRSSSSYIIHCLCVLLMPLCPCLCVRSFPFLYVISSQPDNISSVFVRDDIPGTDHDAMMLNIEAEYVLDLLRLNIIFV